MNAASLTIEDAKKLYESGHLDFVTISYLFGVPILVDHFPDVVTKVGQSVAELKIAGLISIDREAY